MQALRLLQLCRRGDFTVQLLGTVRHAHGAADAPLTLDRDQLASKLLYRSKQRGFLELDLLVGLWAEQTIPKMDVPMLKSLEMLLDQENPDLFKWLTNQVASPPDMMSNAAYAALKQHVDAQLAGMASATRASSGVEWRRGWEDNSR